MSLIKKITLEQIVDYSDNELEYFEHDDTTSQLSDYQQVTDKIRVAEQSVKIATTSEISDDIYDALHQNSHANIYLLCQSFQTASKTLSRFDRKKPIVAREVSSLDNNFIIIDDVSYLMVNPLSDKDNLVLRFDENQTEDLNFIFNYLFWNCATLEKLIDKTSSPVESPFPPFDNRKLDTINLTEDKLNQVDTLYIPRNKKFSSELSDDIAIKYFSDDIKTPIYVAQQLTQIGRINIKNMAFEVENCWKLQTACLADISTDTDIIPLQESWTKTLKITPSINVNLKEIAAQTIDEMKATKPATFPAQQYTQSACFKWNVLPPTKPSKAKKSSLYRQYDSLVTDFSQQLAVLEKILNEVKQESGRLSAFLGMSRKVTKDLEKLAKYQQRELINEKPNELRAFLTKEFEVFFKVVVESQKSFKSDKLKQEAQQRWEKLKKEKNAELDNKQKELEKLKNSLTNKNEKNKNKQEQKKLKNLESNIERLKQDLDNNYTSFVYKPKQNELSNLSKEKAVKCKEFAVPRFALPETGVLYESNDSYYLEIKDNEQLHQAKELAKRYNDKNYQVVVGAGNE